MDLSDIVITGTRGAPRAKKGDTVPVDVIRINQAGMPTAKMDLTSVLNITAPSFNYNKQTGADGADHIDLGTLRGLARIRHWYSSMVKDAIKLHLWHCSVHEEEGKFRRDLNGFSGMAVDRGLILARWSQRTIWFRCDGRSHQSHS